MSSKLEIRYLTDGLNTLTSVKTRQGEKRRTITLPKKVQEYADAHGHYSLVVDHSWDHLIIKGGGEVLMDIDINGTNNNESITKIVSYTWIY